MISEQDRRDFLAKDLYNTLRYLVEGAVAWAAWKASPGSNIFRHQGVLAMYASLMEARALYGFFHEHEPPRHADEARADDFVSNNWKAPKNPVYTEYMAWGKPANKRMFHLVYGRAQQAGPNPLNEQVLEVAKDLRKLTEDFIKNITNADCRTCASKALQDALCEAEKAARHYSITNPL
jgi:hypothetical protein